MVSSSISVYHDFQGIAALKRQARQDQAGSLERVARQFESLFIQMMVKQMRQASFGGGIFDSDRTRQYQDMYDKQLALHLAESGGLGISELLERQLGSESSPPLGGGAELKDYWNRSVVKAVPQDMSAQQQQAPVEWAAADEASMSTVPLESPQQFIQSLWSAAERAASRIGLPPEALLAQAALESGWGKHVMTTGDGHSSHNLFGIKADPGWEGERVRRVTLEYEDGVAVQRRESFRSYDSYAESFQDYVEFLQNNPRYLDALTKTYDSRAYFQALQEAGYATDPHYADKIVSLLEGYEMQRARAQLKSADPLPL
jgi:flagellar protein FlgJ